MQFINLTLRPRAHFCTDYVPQHGLDFGHPFELIRLETSLCLAAAEWRFSNKHGYTSPRWTYTKTIKTTSYEPQTRHSKTMQMQNSYCLSTVPLYLSFILSCMEVFYVHNTTHYHAWRFFTYTIRPNGHTIILSIFLYG
jgi:hypothetical protein